MEAEIFLFQNLLAAHHRDHVTTMTDEALSAADTEDYMDMPDLIDEDQVAWVNSTEIASRHHLV
jgi:hypothetical protein